MPDKHIWVTEATLANLRSLARRWGLTDSATIARALELAKDRE